MAASPWSRAGRGGPCTLIPVFGAAGHRPYRGSNRFPLWFPLPRFGHWPCGPAARPRQHCDCVVPESTPGQCCAGGESPRSHPDPHFPLQLDGWSVRNSPSRRPELYPLENHIFAGLGWQRGRQARRGLLQADCPPASEPAGGAGGAGCTEACGSIMPCGNVKAPPRLAAGPHPNAEGSPGEGGTSQQHTATGRSLAGSPHLDKKWPRSLAACSPWCSPARPAQPGQIGFLRRWKAGAAIGGARAAHPVRCAAEAAARRGSSDRSARGPAARPAAHGAPPLLALSKYARRRSAAAVRRCSGRTVEASRRRPAGRWAHR